MKQRVSIIRALANDPEVLLMDEPLGALDAQTRIVLQDELLRIWEETRKTVVYITHSLDEAILLGDRVILMTAHPGRLLSTFHIDIKRPRTIETMNSPEFSELRSAIWGELSREVTRAMEMQG
jgi:NitT/TauT family transport system ATP-binding protein